MPSLLQGRALGQSPEENHVNVFVEENSGIREEEVQRHSMVVKHGGCAQKAAKSPCGWCGMREEKQKVIILDGVQGPRHLEHRKNFGLYYNCRKKLLEGFEP